VLLRDSRLMYSYPFESYDTSSSVFIQSLFVHEGEGEEGASAKQQHASTKSPLPK